MFMTYLYSNPGYREKYIKFTQTPPIKRGKCFGMSIVWITKCLESEVNNKNTEKYLRMNIDDDFFWESFSMQRFQHSLMAFTRCKSSSSPSSPSFLRDKKFDFLSRMDNRNRVRRQNNLKYELEFSLLTKKGRDILTNDFFNGVVTSGLFGIVIGLECHDQAREVITYHATALLQIKDKRYLFDPSLGVLNVTNCNNILDALIDLTCFYMRPPIFSKTHFRIDPNSEAIGVIPRFIT